MAVYQEIDQILVQKGLWPKIHLLENEASKVLKYYFGQEGVDWQLVAAHIHRQYTAKGASEHGRIIALRNSPSQNTSS